MQNILSLCVSYNLYVLATIFCGSYDLYALATISMC